MTSTPGRQLFTPTATHDALTTATPTIYGPFHTPSEAASGQAVNRSSLAALTFLVWDIMTTFDDEVKYIWPRPRSYIKTVYFFVRYVPVLVEASILCIGTELTPRFHFTPYDCFIWQVYQAVAVTLVIVAVDTILILRVFALFTNSPIIHNILKVAFVVEVISMILGITLAIPKIRYNDICLVIYTPETFGLWLASLFFQILLFVLTAHRFYSIIKGGLGSVPLVLIIVRDGTWAFCLLFIIYTGYAALVILPHNSYSGVLFGWLLAAFSFAGYRIILNLCRFGSAQQNNGTTELPSHHTRQTGTDIQFTSHRLLSGLESYELRALPSKTSRCEGQASRLPNIPELQRDISLIT